MEYSFEAQRQPSWRRLVGIVAVALLHLLLVYGLVTGLARQAFEVSRKTIQTAIIEEIKPPPPPPRKEVRPPEPKARIDAPPPPFIPPPEVVPPAVTGPSIAAVVTPPAVPVSPPVPSTPPVPVTARVDEIGVHCPVQTKPEMPRKAEQEGIGGVVLAEAQIRNGRVVHVRVLSGPRIFHDSVRAAMEQYRCQVRSDDVLAVQKFIFNVN